MKKNLPDLASTLVRPPSSGFTSISSYPLLDESTEGGEWDRRRGFESARELAELRQQNKRLGEAVSWIVETLHREVDEGVGEETLQMQGKQSLESLSYVRDVLSGRIHQIDERRLWGEEEFKRRWEAHGTSTSAGTRSGSSRDGQQFAPKTTIPSSVNDTLRGFISSSTARVVSAAPDHNRSASTVASRATLPQRAPVRVSASNPFLRVATVVDSSTSPEVRVQHDPLGVLR